MALAEKMKIRSNNIKYDVIPCRVQYSLNENDQEKDESILSDFQLRLKQLYLTRHILDSKLSRVL